MPRETQRDLFETEPAAVAVPEAPGLCLTYDATWVALADADAWLAALHLETPWRQDRITLFGRTSDVPRLTAWYGDPGCSYRYAGLQLDPLPWTPTLQALRPRVEAAAGTAFNSVLLNLYRSGDDSMGWHADDEPELGPAPVIASVSLGAARTFQLKHRQDRGQPRIDLELAHGSLLVMYPPTQSHWLHGVPKRRRGEPGPRINLTFRHVVPTPRKGSGP